MSGTRTRDVLVGGVEKSGGRIDGRGAVIAPPSDPAGRCPERAASKPVIRGNALTADNDTPCGRRPRELDEAGAWKTFRHALARVGDGQAQGARAGFVQPEGGIEQAVAVRRHDIALFEDRGRGVVHRRLQDEPRDRVAKETIPTEGEGAIEPSASQLAWLGRNYRRRRTRRRACRAVQSRWARSLARPGHSFRPERRQRMPAARKD
jgi:hypothetical protein